MDQAQRQSMRMVFVLMVSAIFCAAATFGAINFVSEREGTPERIQPAGPRDVVVDGRLITVNGDPEKSILLLDEVSTPPDPAALGLDLEFQGPAQPPLTPEPTPTATPLPPVTDPIVFVNYVVRPGDTLYGIAEAMNSSIELMAQHGIDSDDLAAGGALSIPVANPDYCLASRAYVVRDRDTAFRIAQQFGTTVQAIGDLNGLDEAYTIRVTQVICIP